MSNLTVQRVGDSITVAQDGKVFMILTRNLAMQLASALWRMSVFGYDSLDDVTDLLPPEQPEQQPGAD